MVANSHSKARVVIRNKGDHSTVREYTPLKAKVYNNGRKKPDELITTLNITNRARNGDEIYFVEDNANLEYCSAIWNFQLSCRDERGYNYDPSNHATGTITLSGVAVDDTVTVNGKTYTAKASPTLEGEFSQSGTDTQDAESLRDAINNDTRIGTEPNIGLMATSSGAVVTVIASQSGTVGNAITFSESPVSARITIPATMTGGTDDDPDASRFTEATSGRFQGNYQLAFTVANQEITIPNLSGYYKSASGRVITNRINLSGQFDILITFTPDTAPGIAGGADPVLFSRYSSGDNTGLEIGLDEDGITGNWYPYIRVGNGSTTTTTMGTTAIIMDEGVSDNQPHQIRVCRGADNIIRMFSDGEEDATDKTESASLHSATADIIFGSDAGGTKDYSGELNQIRIYSGNCLKDSEYKSLQTGKFQPMIMKFGGTVWERRDKTATKEIKAQSFSKDLNNFNVTFDAITKARLSTVQRGQIGANGDAFYSGKKTPNLGHSLVEGISIGSTGLELYVINDSTNAVEKWLTTSSLALDTAAKSNDTATGWIRMNPSMAGDTVTVNGLVYTGVSGAKTDFTEWDATVSDNLKAIDLADSIEQDSRVGTVPSGVIIDSIVSDTINLSAAEAGAEGNNINLAESGNTDLSGSSLEGGGVDTFTVTTQDSQPKDIMIRDNNEWYMVGTSSNKVWYYVMGTSNSIKTSTVQGTGFSVSSQTTAPRGLTARAGHLYVCSQTTIYEYTMTGADTNTAVYASRTLAAPAGETALQGIWIDANGDHLYAVGNTNDKVYHWDLSTSWDLSTATLIDSLEIDLEDDEPRGLFVDASGDFLVVLGTSNDRAFKYNLRSQWNLITANRYAGGEMDEIIKDLINNLDPTFLVRTKATMPAEWTGTFLADGKFSELMNLLLVRNNLTFYITPRKVIIIEDQVENGTKQKTAHEFYQLDPITNTQTSGGVNGTGVHTPYDITTTVDNDEILINEITLIGSKRSDGTNLTSNVKLQVEGEKVHSLRINIPQISNQTDLDNLRDSIIGLNNTVSKSFKIVSKKDIHHIRPNQLVKVFNAGIDITADVFYKVEAIENMYPESSTVIYVNQYPINFFELARTETKQVDGLQSESVVPTVIIPPD